MPVYRRDNEGRVVAYSDELVGCHTLMDQHAEKDDFEKMLIRRAGELPHRRVTALQSDAINEEVFGIASVVRRRMAEMPRPRAQASPRAKASPTPRRFQKSAPAPRKQPDLATLPFGSRLVAVSSFTFKTQSGRMSKVTAGITYVSKDSEAYKAKPSAFQYAA
jgi:hypothetical protein